MRTVSLFLFFSLSVSAFAESYRVSQLKFDNFRAYEQYGIDLGTIRSVLNSFNQSKPTFEQSGLFELAAQLADVYRSKGLSFHRVEVKIGTPTRLILVPGFMFDIDVRGNKLYKNSQLVPFFASLKGQLVDNATLQEAMARMNTLPGINGFAFLSFGAQPGQAILNVNANNESWGQVSNKLNNYGTASTGEYRLVTQLTLNNPLKLSEQWEIGASLSDSLANWSTNVSADFHRMGKSIWSVSGQYQNMALEQEFELLNLSGWQASAQLGYKRIALQKLNKTMTFEITTGYIQQSLDNEAFGSLFDIELQDIPFGINLTGDFAAGSSYLGYKMNAEAGWLNVYEAPLPLSENYWAKTQAELSWAQSITGGSIQRGIDLKVKINGQYALTALPSHRRYSLSGQNKVAAYRTGEFTADTGAFGEASLTLLNLSVGPFQTVWQGVGQAGWGQTGDTEINDLYALGGVIDLYLGPFNGQLKAFTDLDLKDYILWFETTLSFPNGG